MTSVKAYKAYYTSIGQDLIGNPVSFLFDHRSSNSIQDHAKKLLAYENMENIDRLIGIPDIKVCIDPTDFGDADPSQISFLTELIDV